MSLKHKDYKEANIRFLEENLEKEGVMELPCGIQYKILLKGTGPVPTAKNTVKVHYRGTLIDGKVFDDSFARKRPEIFKVKEVIEGWQIALQKMRVGDHWIVYIPYNMGYGTRTSGPIPAFSTLIFEVQLLGIA